MGDREVQVDICDWCRRRIVGLGHLPPMKEVVLAPGPRQRQAYLVCPDCYRKLERLISRLGRGERTGAIR
jgi:hypothetical protein